MDFDDLIRLPVRLFDEHPEVRERWQNKLRYPLVDEYQDTNRAQYRCSSCCPACAAPSPRWATTTRRSTPGAAPTSRT